MVNKMASTQAHGRATVAAGRTAFGPSHRSPRNRGRDNKGKAGSAGSAVVQTAAAAVGAASGADHAPALFFRDPIATAAANASASVSGGEHSAVGATVTTAPTTVATAPAPTPFLYGIVKRILDVTASLLVLLLGFPIFALIAFLIWREDRGPVLYSQSRVGRGGRQFKFYKYRSMVRNADDLKATLAARNEAEGPIFKMKDDPRITRVGRVLRRYSLDELPQFLNVLRGEMSLVGPRPHLPCEIEQCANYPAERLSVTPGLLCLREVQGRSNLTFEQWVALDLEYVRHRSLWLDIKILLRAIPAVLKAEGAY
jgi:Sugar transferases involved in lipopolysaccharide synthesis